MVAASGAASRGPHNRAPRNYHKVVRQHYPGKLRKPAHPLSLFLSVVNFIYVLLGGAAGSLLRYSAGLLLPSGTFFVNMTGSFLIGLCATLLPAASPWRLLLITGLLGGYTTFSAFQWELFTSLQTGFPWQAALNAAASILFGLAACWAGAALANMLR